MTIDKKYCMNSFLMFRTIADDDKCFVQDLKPNIFHVDFPRIPVANGTELEEAIKTQMKEWTKDGKAALAVSGGIDSAILAKYMPEGSKAYTFQCIVPGVEVTNEVPQASLYAAEAGLEHEVIQVFWEDFEKYAPILMKHKGAPIHSIEVQIYKAALKAKEDGFERLIFGESSDVNYGGLSGLMSRNWTFGEFVERYSYLMPHKVLKDAELILEPYKKFEKDGYVDAHEFCRNFFLEEGMGSYVNACQCAGIEVKSPYVNTYLSVPLDYERVRAGENKYVVREVFEKLYPDWKIPTKTPMPRPMNEWFADWKGPEREEFWPNCVSSLTGDQKWQLWALETFLNMLDKK